MKKSDVIRVLAQETKAQDAEGINKALKAKNFTTKFRLTGPGFVHFGFTGKVKAVTEEGLKIYNTNRVNLVRFEDIDTFSKAIPREERKGPTPLPTEKKKAAPANKKAKPVVPNDDLDDEEDYENDDDFDAYADEDDDIIEDENFSEKILSQKESQSKKDEDEDRLSKKKKRLHQKGSGSLFIPKKK